jgi:hypothetical protein
VLLLSAIFEEVLSFSVTLFSTALSAISLLLSKISS